MPRLTIPCHILFAADDPLIDAHVFDGVALPPNVQVICTRYGGHLGFLGRPGGAEGTMDAQLLAWITARLCLMVCRARTRNHDDPSAQGRRREQGHLCEFNPPSHPLDESQPLRRLHKAFGTQRPKTTEALAEHLGLDPSSTEISWA